MNCITTKSHLRKQKINASLLYEQLAFSRLVLCRGSYDYVLFIMTMKETSGKSAKADSKANRPAIAICLKGTFDGPKKQF